MHNLTDIQLIRHIRTTQDEHACEELIRRYYGVLRQLVKYKVPARTDIDDIVQEVMIKVITKIDQLRDPSKFKPWIYRIVRSQIQDYFRTAYPQIENTIANEEHTLLDTYLVTESSEDAILHKLEMSDIYDIILGFPVENVKPFLLHHLDNLSYAEIAAVTQEKPSTVRGRIARTKSSLGREMFDRSVPQEIRARLAAKLSQIATDGSYVIHHLKADFFQNKALLDELDSRRMSIAKPTIYFTKSLDNLMIVADMRPSVQVCVIKVKSKEAIPILLNRISTAKRLHCIFLSSEYLDYAKQFLHFVSEITAYSFVAEPASPVTPIATSCRIVEKPLDSDASYMSLLDQDPGLGYVVEQVYKEYGNDPSRFRVFAAYDHITTELRAYAFFVQIDNHLWELSRYVSFAKSSDDPLRACIAAGTESLVSLGFYVSNTGVQENDRVFLELAPLMGYQELYRFTSGMVEKI
jgi:RNA polymerase sigma-70 factor (ECF subfamily)